MGAKLTVWGVRGALPAADRSFLEYGGNTSCISVEHAGGILCFDAGTGLSRLLSRHPRPRRLDILISHVHMDHIWGLYSLSALGDVPVRLYGEERQGVSLRERLETVVGPPYWPLALSSFPAQIHFHPLAPGDELLLPGDVRVRTLRGSHPDGGSLLYRAELGESSVTYALDCELDGDMAERLADFARGSGLLVWDANFAPADLRRGWGHSTWAEGLAVGRAAGAKRILMTHFDRSYPDAFLHEQEQLAQRENSACIFAREGMEIDL